MRDASTRFDNELRYRPGDDDAQTQFTPAYVLEPVRVALGGRIDLDPCTTGGNPCEADRFLTVEEDGLRCSWAPRPGLSIYVNPPYGRAREPWVEKCVDAGRAGAGVVLLIPAHTDTRAFQRALASAATVVLIKGRVKFGVLRPNLRQIAASHPSALLGWNVDLTPCAHLGAVVKPASHDLADVRSVTTEESTR